MAKLFEQRSVSLANPPKWLVEMMGHPSAAGQSVTVMSALGVPAVLSAFTILMEDTASLPLILYRRLTRGKERATDHSLYSLLHDAPNPEHTSMTYRQFIMGHLLGWGNHYSQKIWDARGRLLELWPLRPDRMEVFRDRNGERKYMYTLANGEKRAFTSEEIFHVPGFGFDGLIGYSRISLARNAIGLAMAAEQYASNIFKNDARPSIVLKSKKKLTDEAKDNLTNSWKQLYQGNGAGTAVLEEDMDIESIGFPPEDTQFMQTREFQSVEVAARVFRIPPFMFGATEKSTSWGTGIEQQELGYLSHTLRPWLVSIEQGISKDLLLESERGKYTAEHLTDALLRTDIGSRFEAYAKAITNGFMTRNEAREKENWNPLDKLDEPLVPLNMTVAGTVKVTDQPSRKFDPRPFILDSAQRMMKRERNDVLDAAKRWKEKPEKFVAWLEQFYKRDHAAFVLKNFAPVMDERVGELVVSYCDQHGKDVLEAWQEGRELEKMFDEWTEIAPEQLTGEILSEDVTHE